MTTTKKVAGQAAPKPVDEPEVETVPEGEPRKPLNDKPAEGNVFATVTKAGAGRIHTGGPTGETFDRRDVIELPIATAAKYEEKHWVEAD